MVKKTSDADNLTKNVLVPLFLCWFIFLHVCLLLHTQFSSFLAVTIIYWVSFLGSSLLCSLLYFFLFGLCIFLFNVFSFPISRLTRVWAQQAVAKLFNFTTFSCFPISVCLSSCQSLQTLSLLSRLLVPILYLLALILTLTVPILFPPPCTDFMFSDTLVQSSHIPLPHCFIIIKMLLCISFNHFKIKDELPRAMLLPLHFIITTGLQILFKGHILTWMGDVSCYYIIIPLEERERGSQWWLNRRMAWKITVCFVLDTLII